MPGTRREIALQVREITRKEALLLRRTVLQIEVPENARQDAEIRAPRKIQRRAFIAIAIHRGLLQGTHPGTTGIHQGAVDVE